MSKEEKMIDALDTLFYTISEGVDGELNRKEYDDLLWLIEENLISIPKIVRNCIEKVDSMLDEYEKENPLFGRYK